MAKKYYAVWRGRKTGIFDSWAQCKIQVEHFPGAGYKSFTTLEEAQKAFFAECNEPVEYYCTKTPPPVDTPSYSPGTGQKKKSRKPTYRTASLFSELAEPLPESIAVDASCIGNPGILEYRGVMVKTGEVIFSRGPFPRGTNNIGEFLAIVDGMRYCRDHGLSVPIYSDSMVAIKWVRDRECKTTLKKENNEALHQLIRDACEYLKGSAPANPVLKWDTSSWGEIPADYDRK
jgi:ribonuclease HI